MLTSALLWNWEGALRRSNFMSVNIELTSQETSPSPTLFSVHSPHSPPAHSLYLSLLFCLFLVHKGSAQMSKAYVLLPVSGMKVNIKQLLISSFGFFIPSKVFLLFQQQILTDNYSH